MPYVYTPTIAREPLTPAVILDDDSVTEPSPAPSPLSSGPSILRDQPADSITAIAFLGRSYRLRQSPPTTTSPGKPHTCPSTRLVPANGYNTILKPGRYTPDTPALANLFMDATRNRACTPYFETRVAVWNIVEGERQPNGSIPPYVFGASVEEGVVTVYRSFKLEDLAQPPLRVEFSDVICAVWMAACRLDHCTYSSSSSDKPKFQIAGQNKLVEFDSDDGQQPQLEETYEEAVVEKSIKGIKFVAVVEITNVDFRRVTRWAFAKFNMDINNDTLIVDSENTMNANEECYTDPDAQPWTMFDAFMGTPTLKSIQRMAEDNREALGNVYPSRLYVNYGVFECPIAPFKSLLPCLLVEFKKW
ncbi:hypothetical protein TWF696_007682 [Orbilia brochopaga]|uniref:Uncharacterized protein n=1 Tax=Orbilia brochopaga TaxID=3140254 RepID=A0AAV9UPB2_9PEZI